MTNTLRRWLAMTSWVGLAWLSGCGGGGDGTPTPGPQGVQTQPASTATATIGASGGKVSATSTGGVRYTLFIPPGALAADTAISVTPITSMGDAPLAQGLRGAARFAPSGLAFQRPATLRIEGATPARAGLRSVGFSRSEDGKTMRLSLPDTSGGALDIPVFHFSDAGVADGTQSEVAAVPPATPSQLLQERLFDALGRLDIDVSSLDGKAGALKDAFDQLIKPVMDAGTASTDPTLQRDGLTAFLLWTLDKRILAPDGEEPALDARLSSTLTVALPQAAGLARALLATRMAACISGPSAATLEEVMRLRSESAFGRLATLAFGLDPADTLRQVNDCVRLVIDPIGFPDSVPVGTPRSLDARARLVPATRPQELFDAPIGFTVASNDAAVASPTGLSDASGRYTVVVTPNTTAPRFSVKACYALTMDPFPPSITDLCTTVSVPDGAPPPFVAVSFGGTYTPSPDNIGKACAIGERSGPGGNALTAFLTLDEPRTGIFILDTQNDNRDDSAGFFARIGLSWEIGSGGAFIGSGGGAFSSSARVTYRGMVTAGAIDLEVNSITTTGVECSGRFVGSQTEVIKR